MYPCSRAPRARWPKLSASQIAMRLRWWGEEPARASRAGAIARNGGIVIAFSRMNRIVEIDAANLRAVVQPGVVNLDLSRAVDHLDLDFAPDPSSQKSCTIGGNVSENSGGPHTLAYGVTASHVTGLRTGSAPDGQIVRTGRKSPSKTSGYDLDGLLVGSEGTLALVTEITVRLMRKPEAVKTLLAVYETLDDTTESVVDITVRAITPAACEMLDGFTLRAVEDYVHAGFPKDCAAVLLIEVEGLIETVEAQAAQITEVCKLHHAREVRVARDDRERDLLWKGRKNAFGALGRLSPMYYVQDGVIPRTASPRNPAMHRGSWPQVQPANRQYLPRRRRKSPPTDPVRRTRSRAIPACGCRRRRNHEALRCGRWRADRRARCGHGKK